MFEFLKKLFSRDGAATPKAPERAPTSSIPLSGQRLPRSDNRLAETDRADIRDAIGRLTHGGFDTREDILEAAESYAGAPEALPSADRDWIREQVTRAVNDKRAQEATWPATTEFDRLDAVFEALNDHGIIALHRAGVSQQEGREEIADAWRNRKDPSRVVGYAFYDGEDVERALTSGDLWISYGAVEGSPETPQSIGAKVVAALSRSGFTVIAPPDADTRIRVKGLAWRKRSPF